MRSASLTPETEHAIQRALQSSWSERTGNVFLRECPCYCQCAQTTIIVQEAFGGEILKTHVSTVTNDETEHFYNCIGGQRYDFTAAQFSIENTYRDVIYEDIRSNHNEAMAGLKSSHIDVLKHAFEIAFKELDTN